MRTHLADAYANRMNPVERIAEPASTVPLSAYGQLFKEGVRRNLTQGRDPRCARFQRVTGCFGSPSRSCKLLYAIHLNALKRLASAVRFRPWPPTFFNEQLFAALKGERSKWLFHTAGRKKYDLRVFILPL